MSSPFLHIRAYQRWLRARSFGGLGAVAVDAQLKKIVSFVQNVYVPDGCAIAGFYRDWFSTAPA